ncbi:uncharacterized protein LOC105421102 [Amborella trichopoda]|uniref:uncharacterized protein LOC105421102 n=1 Tax=Amborella trichopoda TaxID=13333 RepID=UPI0005D33489|nr:uncharacterized protein LOC105421102 [Amborella trichopoda]|eukprot:XP_011625574.1 uncharacterized protein LOC105421102 [Amborella trichopoda]
MYHPRANGLVEAFNKTLYSVLGKSVSRTKKNWHKKLLESLWAYRTTSRSATDSTPYSLVYGSEAILPLEIQLPSLHITVYHNMIEDEQVMLRYQELDALDEKRFKAQLNLELHQGRMKSAFDTSVKVCSFTIGDLVLTVKPPIVMHGRCKGKFEPK